MDYNILSPLLEIYLQLGQSNLVRLVGVSSWNQSTASSTSVYNLHHIQSTTSFPVLLFLALVEHFMTNSQTLRRLRRSSITSVRVFCNLLLTYLPCCGLLTSDGAIVDAGTTTAVDWFQDWKRLLNVVCMVALFQQNRLCVRQSKFQASSMQYLRSCPRFPQ